jgi:hypothetical protein
MACPDAKSGRRRRSPLLPFLSVGGYQTAQVLHRERAFREGVAGGVCAVRGEVVVRGKGESRKQKAEMRGLRDLGTQGRRDLRTTGLGTTSKMLKYWCARRRRA